MTETQLLWSALGLLVSVVAWQALWIVQHHKACHSEPMARIAAIEQRVATTEGECERLAKNAHDDRSTLSACVLDVARLERGR